jgi:hypothetical protein
MHAVELVDELCFALSALTIFLFQIRVSPASGLAARHIYLSI